MVEYKLLVFELDGLFHELCKRRDCRSVRLFLRQSKVGLELQLLSLQSLAILLEILAELANDVLLANVHNEHFVLGRKKI